MCSGKVGREGGRGRREGKEGRERGEGRRGVKEGRGKGRGGDPAANKQGGVMQIVKVRGAKVFNTYTSSMNMT